MKKDVFHEGRRGHQLTVGELLIAAGVAGMPAAYLTTPFDVVKTRLQAERRVGHTHYKGLFDALVTIPKEEGVRALFKGGLARVLRSSPQFAVTLMMYEVLKKQIPYPWGDEIKPVVAAPSRDSNDLSKIRARNALKILLDTSSRFGQPADTSRLHQLPNILKPQQ